MNNEILLVDDSSLSNEIVKVYIENLTDFVTVVPHNADDALEKYKNSSYAYTIIDNNKEISTKLMSYILDSKVKSNVILLSDGVHCPADCSFCVKNYSFIRLMKPLSPNDVLTYITNSNEKKECPNKHYFDSINSLDKLYEVINLSDNYFFTQKMIDKNKILISSNLNTSLRFNELKQIESLVNDKYFTINVRDNKIEIATN